MTETLHLIASPRNRQNLLESIAQLDRGDTVAAALVDDTRE